MDYRKMAEELLIIRAVLRKINANQKMSKFLKGELFVLNYLACHNRAAHPKELSIEMAVSTARIAVLLKTMEEKGWIKRTEDFRDNRQTIVTLTHEGYIEIEKHRKEAIDSISEVLESIGSEDAQEFLRIQKKIVDKCFRQK